MPNDAKGTERSRALREIHQLFLSERKAHSRLVLFRELLERYALALDAAFRDGSAAPLELSRIHGVRSNDAAATAYSLDEARQAVAKEHDFADWNAVKASSAAVHAAFEDAADAIVDGDEDVLVASLAKDPELARRRSPQPHAATLLHYITANGVEAHRQWQSPSTAVTLARRLLDAGADPNATANIYGGGSGSTPLDLLVTSSHPTQAGVDVALAKALCDGGALANGIDGDGSPLWRAVLSCRAHVADQLVRCGARADQPLLAAALGRLDAARSAFEHWASRAHGDDVVVLGKTLPADRLLDYSLIFAAGNGRRETVEFLLGEGPDLTAKDPFWGGTAIGWARYHRRTDIEEVLAKRAP